MINDPPKNLEAYQAIIEINSQNQRQERKQNYWKAYILSIGLPPIGIYYFIKYFFFIDDENARKTAAISLILTVISLFLSIWLMQSVFTQTLPNSTENINFMKELITPENQKTIQDLLR